MDEIKVDVAIIGAGTAGLGAYRNAKKHRERVVMIEGGPYGTTCARVGCMPSKLLIAAAEAAHQLEKAPAFGVHFDGAPRIEGREVMARVKRERDRFVGFVVESVENIPAEDRLRGYARFIDNHRLQVDGKVVHARTVVIATGSSPAVPGMFRDLGDRLLVNDAIFEWDDLPKSVAVFGPGVIGLELGQALHRLGVRVRIFGRGGNVGPLTDPAVLEKCATTLSEEFYLDPDAVIGALSREEDHVVITYKHRDGDQRTESFDYVIAATGRTPNVRNLGLENTDLPLDERGVPVHDPYTMQVGDSHVFIAGDATNERPLLHEAADEGRIAGENAGRYPDIRAGVRRSSLGIVFSDPQIAMVGCSYKMLTEGCFAVGEVSFDDQGRSRVMLRNKGLLRVYAEHGTGLFKGAEMFGPAAEHIGHLLAWAHQRKMTIAEMLAMPFYHPVIEEGVRTALRDVNNKLHLGPVPVPRCLDCGPGA
ncbi:dihydrolipoyl dehydrogenase [Acanthopleuribacter pedis]|uniref:Dihydrolipoyl dehydrogenase n=1 Tax=Acanthopleuribacter pedis TaxID=442870 RepID=A0A8J7QEQ2_9BACT|nr:dihydrolipoyl dehydrogenase [Acanthopleuribacter pedis]MBO1318380.1 dihydrolipoyl dehydrogenase [Acanthopleuribacter pedis]